MTRQEYLDISALRMVLNASQILQGIIPENVPDIPRSEYQTVMRLLDKWQDKLFKKAHEARE